MRSFIFVTPTNDWHVPDTLNVCLKTFAWCDCISVQDEALQAVLVSLDLQLTHKLISSIQQAEQ